MEQGQPRAEGASGAEEAPEEELLEDEEGEEEPSEDEDDEEYEEDDEDEPRPPSPGLLRALHLGGAVLLSLAIGALLGGAALGVHRAQVLARAENERLRAQAAAAPPQAEETDNEDEADGDAVTGSVVGATLGTGRTFGQALASLGVDARTAGPIAQALRVLVDPRTLRATDQVAVERGEGAGGEAVLRAFLVRGQAAWEVLQDEQGEWHAQVRTEPMPEVQWRGRVPAPPPANPGGDRGGTSSAQANPRRDTEAAFRVTQAGAVTGYVHGRSVSLRVVMVENIPVEERTAGQYQRMHEAAARDGVQLRLVSGFRTMEHQRYLYALYRAGRGNLAAVPGQSNHQSGHALDLNTRAPGVYPWLQRNAARYGFRRTVPTEPWHWECW